MCESVSYLSSIECGAGHLRTDVLESEGQAVTVAAAARGHAVDLKWLACGCVHQDNRWLTPQCCSH